jgi:hypothetical protein
MIRLPWPLEWHDHGKIQGLKAFLLSIYSVTMRPWIFSSYIETASKGCGDDSMPRGWLHMASHFYVGWYILKLYDGLMKPVHWSLMAGSGFSQMQHFD